MSLASIFKELGVQFEMHDDLFESDTPDVEWLDYCGRLGRVVIASDKNIKKNPVEYEAYRRASLAVFFFSKGDWTTDEKLEALRIAFPKIANLLLSERRPFIARINKSGKVEKWINHKGKDFLSRKRS